MRYRWRIERDDINNIVDRGYLCKIIFLHTQLSMNLYEDFKREIYDLIYFVPDKSIKVCEETNGISNIDT